MYISIVYILGYIIAIYYYKADHILCVPNSVKMTYFTVFRNTTAVFLVGEYL